MRTGTAGNSRTVGHLWSPNCSWRCRSSPTWTLYRTSSTTRRWRCFRVMRVAASPCSVPLQRRFERSLRHCSRCPAPRPLPRLGNWSQAFNYLGLEHLLMYPEDILNPKPSEFVSESRKELKTFLQLAKQLREILEAPSLDPPPSNLDIHKAPTEHPWNAKPKTRTLCWLWGPV